MAWKHAPGWVLAATLAVLAGCSPAPPAHQPQSAHRSPVTNRTPAAGRPAAAPSPRATWYPAGPSLAGDAGPAAARFFMEVVPSNNLAHVVVAATGQVTATIRVPGRGFLTGVAAAGDDRTFVLAAAPSATQRSRYYELRLDPRGVPGPLSLLAVPPLNGQQLPFAVSQDGSDLAISSPGANAASRGEIVVVSLATGATRTWRSPHPGGANGLSWAGDARLAFDWWDTSRPARAANRQSGVRLLDTRAPGHDLLASSRLLVPASVRFGRYTGVLNPLISPDGSTVFAAMTAHGGNPRSTVVEFSARTGHPRRAVTPSADESGHGAWCGALWTDLSGRHAVAVCFRMVRIDRGRFTTDNLHFAEPIAAPFGDNFFAW